MMLRINECEKKLTMSQGVILINSDSDEDETSDDLNLERVYSEVLAFVFLLTHRCDVKWLRSLEKVLNIETLREDDDLGTREILRSAKKGEIRNTLHPPTNRKNGGYRENGFLDKVRKKLFGIENAKQKKERNKTIRDTANRIVLREVGDDESLALAVQMDVDIETSVDSYYESEEESDEEDMKDIIHIED